MLLRQISDPHLSQYGYLIGCQRTGEAIVIDPERDIDIYQALAEREGLRITAVAETHIHADFVSGAREFAAADPSIRLYLSAEGGPDWRSEWALGLPGFVPLHDGDEFRIGNIHFRALHTPGHTPEHMVFVVTDIGSGAELPMAMLSGDFLFVGDAGRPDLLEQAAGMAGTQEAGARQLFRSMGKLASLPDFVQVLPAHGAGSACGKALGAVPSSTLGYERHINPALKLALQGGEDAFVDYILSGQPEPPDYFANMKRVNKVGPAVLGALPRPRAWTIAELEARLDDPVLAVVDTRDRAAFLAGHLRNSLFAPPAKFSDFAGSYLDPSNEIVLVVRDASMVEDLVRQLVRMGFDHILGFVMAADVGSAPPALLVRTEVTTFADVPALLSRGGSAVQLAEGVRVCRRASSGGHESGAHTAPAEVGRSARRSTLDRLLPERDAGRGGLCLPGAGGAKSRLCGGRLRACPKRAESLR